MINFKNEVAKLLEGKVEGLSFDEILEAIEAPKYSDMGDYAFPCFRLAKTMRKAPNIIAADVAEALGTSSDYFEKIEAVAAYVNFTIKKETLAKDVIEEVIAKGDDFGGSDLGNGKNVIVEFSSTNIAKPFHMGHIRSTMIGNSIYKIYTFLGYNTTAINHLGDYGTQFGKLIVSYKLWGDKATIESNPIPELLKIYVKFHEEAEENPDLEDQARGWFTKLENGDAEAQELWSWFRDISLVEFDRVYGMLGVHFDSYAGESFYSDKMGAVLTEMREKGIMKKSEGAEIVDLEDYNMPPALITKKDGSSLYITRDITAAIYRKNHYNFDKNIYVVGTPQKLHFQQWMKVIELLGNEWAKDCVHVDFGTVSLESGSLSTRSGRVVFLEDVLKKATEKIGEIIEEKNPNLPDKGKVAADVGIGAVVFQELSNNRIKDYMFSWEKTLSFEGETGPYVQYTHARASSVIKKATASLEGDINFSLLNDHTAVELIREIRKLPGVIIDASIKYEPSVVTRHTIKIAQAFNAFYHENQINVEDEELSKARLALAMAAKQALKNGLFLIGLNSPEQM
jgi:arginyl-tRNA synthetase